LTATEANRQDPSMQDIPESHVDLVSQPLGCVITTIAPSGLPQSTGMWFLFDEGAI